MKFFALFMLLAFAVCEPVAQAQWSNGNTEELSPKEKRKQAKQEAKQARKEAAEAARAAAAAEAARRAEEARRAADRYLVRS